MFTGIIEAVGVIESTRDLPGIRRVRVRAPGVTDGVVEGASVAVDGACLTAVDIDPEGFTFELVSTTMAKTIAGTYEAGTHVNLERALRLGDRLDGHLVQGHVDGTGSLVRSEEEGDTRLLTFEVPGAVGRWCVPQGAITINGVSLTVADLPSDERLQVAIIPHTWGHTNLSRLAPGSPVNLEGDLIGKYVDRLLTAHRGER